MSPIVLSVTIVAYFAILFTISYIAGHKADNEGFFVGNHKSAWYIVAFAMIGSTISGVTFVSVPGMVQASSFSYLQMVLGFIVGQIIIAFVLVPLFYRMNLVSIYEYLENRFGSSSYKTGAWFFFYLKDVGGSRTAIPRLSDTATAHFRALSPPFPAERHSHRIYCVALYIPGRCEITDMDRCTQNILSRCFCCPVHLLYSFEPAPEF